MSGVEGWIDWHGGENPVPGLVVQVQWRDQSARYTPDAERCSDEWSWGHHDMYCDIIAYRVVTPAALSAIEGGGGALQPSASVPTEQADGGVVAWRWRWKAGMYAHNGSGPGRWYYEDSQPSSATDHHKDIQPLYTTPPATPIAGGFSSNRQGDLPTEPVVKLEVAFNSHPTGRELTDAWVAGFLHGIARDPWDDMHDYAALCGIEYENSRVMAHKAAEEDAARRDEESGQ